MKRIVKDKKGIVAIELLTIIAVLAFHLLMGGKNNSSQNVAKKQMFAMDANEVISGTQFYLQTNTFMFDASKPTFPTTENEAVTVQVSDLIANGDFTGSNDYEGCVIVTKSSSFYLYKVYLNDGKLMVNGSGVKDGKNIEITSSDVSKYTVNKFDENNECSKNSKATRTGLKKNGIKEYFKMFK